MKRLMLSVLFSALAMMIHAQDSQTVFNFLRLPVSAHAAALGGDNITLSDDDASLVFHNPALLYNVSDRTLGLNMMTYMQGSITGSASYSQTIGERGTWGVQGRFISYGEMKETTYDNQQTGTFGARDIALGGTFAYGLTDLISGGVTAKMVASYIGQYNSLAAAVDLGLNYYDPDSEWSISAVARNLGGQLKAYDDDFERMPLDLQLGVSKRLVGSPLRFSATLVRLNDWQYGIGKHFVLGADLLLSEQFYVAAGYNPLRASEMKITAGDEESSHGAALSLGAGMMLERLQLHIAYGKYHVSSTSLMINFSYAL
ncbi:type IX secretion system protein PorQ [uncultured Prevotella sp.]|uniref:type IX secretion system protein PorQ n=1 Tax=uncultured Prevotella sp. TaxID=159272 RepID=UPI0025FB174B|nr:type IX secretion system protein PorQ [uncultured Prevotella sp.]